MSAPHPTVPVAGVVQTIRDWAVALWDIRDAMPHDLPHRGTHREEIAQLFARMTRYADRLEGEAAKDARPGALPEPRFDSRGGYLVEHQDDALAVAVAALRFVLTCETAYHAQGPASVAHAMAHSARQALDAIAAAAKEVRS